MTEPIAGYVYVLQMEGHPYYKIGRTVSLTRRVGEISPQMPGRLSVVMAHRVPDTRWTESLLHEEFRDRRLNGEWFYLDARCLTEIRAGLLLCQARAVVQGVIDGLHACRDMPSCLIEKHCKVLVIASHREDRRLERVLNMGRERKHHAAEINTIADATLDAEIVG